MGHKLRVEIPGGIFHVIARGNARAKIFLDDLDYAEFLRKLAVVIAECGWLCHAYCLLPNHYHLVIQTPGANLAAGMHRLNGRYARWLNRRLDRVGHVFQGPYRAEPVAGDAHLLELFRYVSLDPVRAGLCAAPADWPWSSYGATSGVAEAPSFLTLEFAHAVSGAAGLRGFVEAA